MMDGGRGQVNIALKVLDELKINIPVCGMVKDDNHRTRGLYYQNKEIPIDRTSEGFKLITRIQDEAHRFAITGMRAKRAKARNTSRLEDLEGIGPKRRQKLLTRFGGMRALKNASLEDIAKIEGISQTLAERIYAQLHGQIPQTVIEKKNE